MNFQAENSQKVSNLKMIQVNCNFEILSRTKNLNCFSMFKLCPASYFTNSLTAQKVSE